MNTAYITLHYCERCGGLISKVLREYTVTKSERYNALGELAIIEDMDEEYSITWCDQHVGFEPSRVLVTKQIFNMLAPRLLTEDFVVVTCVKPSKKALVDASDLLEILL